MNSSAKLGIVQGRLTQSPPGCLQWFPQKEWPDEFRIAADIGIDFIELIAETDYNHDNPIWNDYGIDKLKKLVKKNNLDLYILCNDFIINHCFLEKDVIDQNLYLLEQSRKLGIKKFVMPFFEMSEIDQENMHKYVDPIKRVAEFAADNNILLCLETILNGKDLIDFLKLINMENVKVVFDTGNRVVYKHNLVSDIKLLNNLIAHIHIKDKNINGENVLLGTGLVNFEEVFDALKAISYKGAFTFETTRGKNPINTAQYNVNLVKFFKNNAENN